LFLVLLICFYVLLINVGLLLQFSSSFLEGIADYVDPGLPFISLSKGLELNTLRMMSQIIPIALKNPRQPFVALSGPSFALELMNNLPTAMVVASKDKKLANAVQQLLASSYLRINTSRYNISKQDSIGFNDFWMHFPAGL
jgi:glycerol-3-phosphate dehydrogenase (NAD+)